MLAQLCANTRQQDGEAERLGDIIIGAGFEPENGVGIGVVAGEHENRCLEPALAEDAHRFAAVDIGQANVHNNQVDLAILGGLDALGAILDRGCLELLVQRQLLHQRIAEFRIIVDNQYLADIAHRKRPWCKAALRTCNWAK